MDAMKKLDANLAALLAAENDVNDPVAAKSLDQLKRLESGQNSTLSDLGFNTAQKNNDQHTVDLDAAQQLALFKRVDHLKLQLEALTLQAEGTKRMELLQSEIRPIFTVECQLSHELIKTQPRYDMFNIMQFESEKFQSLTQCTRFGQEDQRAVQLQLNECENGNAGTAPDLGRIHFTVWWREPGTCLNEMLGLGTLDISELYNDALLEQCKCIAIHRRGVHLASLYLKISLQSNGTGNFNGSSITDSDTGGAKQTAEQPNPANTCAGQAANNNNNGNGNGNGNENNNNNTNNDNAGEYVAHFLYPQNTKIR